MEPERIFIKNLALKIREQVIDPIYSIKTKVFLCGANIHDQNTIRFKIDKIFKKYYRYFFEIIYPEDIFDEFLTGPGRENLLKLENILVESVDAVLLIPESPGSIAELGAFTNNDILM